MSEERDYVKHGSYTLKLDINAMVEVEDLTGKGFYDIQAELASARCSLKTLRAIVYASMIAEHPDATIKDAGKILEERPEIIFDLFGVSMPKDDGKQGETKKKVKQAATSQ